MRKFLTIASVNMVALLLATTQLVIAADPDSGMSKQTTDASKHRYFSIPKQIQLTSEQTVALDEIKSKMSPKVAELSHRLNNIMTDEQKTARKTAVAKAKADGITGKTRTAAIDHAVNLTAEQRKQYDELNPELSKLRADIRQQIYGLLTEQQRSYYKLPKLKKPAAM